MVPPYFLLRPLRRSVADVTVDPLPPGAWPLRVASLLISLARMVYLVQALRGA